MRTSCARTASLATTHRKRSSVASERRPSATSRSWSDGPMSKSNGASGPSTTALFDQLHGWTYTSVRPAIRTKLLRQAWEDHLIHLRIDLRQAKRFVMSNDFVEA